MPISAALSACEIVGDVLGADDVDVPGGARTGRRARERDELPESGPLVVRRGCAPAPRPGVELGQLDAEERRLNLVQARVVADELPRLLVPGAVEAQHPRELGDLLAGSGDRAAVPETAEILGREEAERRRRAERAGTPVRTGRPRRLSGVLQHRDTERLDLADRGDVAEQVDGDDRLRGGSQGRVHGLRRDHHRLRIDVAEDGTGAGRWDRLGGRVERERRHDDIVARPDAHRAQGDRQRVRAVGDADDVIDAEIVRELALEGRDLGAEDEPALVDGVGRGTDEAVAEARARSVDIEQGDWHGRGARRASGRKVPALS